MLAQKSKASLRKTMKLYFPVKRKASLKYRKTMQGVLVCSVPFLRELPSQPPTRVIKPHAGPVTRSHPASPLHWR